MTLERRRDLITVLEPYFLPKILHSTKSYFIKAIDHTFYGFTCVITHLGCRENTRKACKSLAFGSWFTSFSRVLPAASSVGYHAGKPIESVVYCLNKPWTIWLQGFMGIHSLAKQIQSSFNKSLRFPYSLLLKRWTVKNNESFRVKWENWLLPWIGAQHNANISPRFTNT